LRDYTLSKITQVRAMTHFWIYECDSGEQTVFTFIKADSQLNAGAAFNAGFCWLYKWCLNGGEIKLNDDLGDFIDYIKQCERMWYNTMEQLHSRYNSPRSKRETTEHAIRLSHT
jgi:hypothetical protein